ncbi:hypothetical protein QJS04_geneDACA016556 [Acorus gramineus]|uniref:Uncharacterized protein n=1 Tax=Acorus gramineus TaxID=55184 RepID=A0AAV9BMG4_ACOGR|nr:hypothetical protein QJS04_geneDACA016556 [Acorus gramineus]
MSLRLRRIVGPPIRSPDHHQRRLRRTIPVLLVTKPPLPLRSRHPECSSRFSEPIRSEGGGGDRPRWRKQQRRTGPCCCAFQESVGDFTAVAEAEVWRQRTEVAVAAAATVVLGVGNRVLYKLALVPLKQYPFFLAQFATFGHKDHMTWVRRK